MVIKKFISFGDNEEEIHHSGYGLVTNERVICPVRKDTPLILKLFEPKSTMNKEIPIEDIYRANYFVMRNSVIGIILIIIGTPIAISGLGLLLGLLFFFGALCLIWGIPRVRIVTLEDTKVIATIYWPWKREVAKAFVSAVNNQLDAKEVNDNH